MKLVVGGVGVQDHTIHAVQNRLHLRTETDTTKISVHSIE